MRKGDALYEERKKMLYIYFKMFGNKEVEGTIF
jgi:hypothetical protein